MENFDTSVSVSEMIQRYHNELMKLKDKHVENIEKASSTVAVEKRLDTQYPLPDVQNDLLNLRNNTVKENSITTPSQAEENAARSENTGQSATQITLQEESLPESSPPPTEMSLGFLRAFVTTAKGALPVPNAQVIITRVIDDQELLEQANRTDISGYTPLFSLPAVSGSYSQAPENATPYTFYNMYVRANGFYPVRLRRIPMYGGITAVQPVSLIPVAEDGDPNQERVIDEGAPENLA